MSWVYSCAKYVFHDFTIAHKHPYYAPIYTISLGYFLLRAFYTLQRDSQCMLRGGVTLYVIGGRVCVSGNLLLVSHTHSHNRSQQADRRSLLRRKRQQGKQTLSSRRSHTNNCRRRSEVDVAMLNTKCYRLV